MSPSDSRTKYKVRTLQEAIVVAAQLPDDRAEVFIQEVGCFIRSAVGIMRLGAAASNGGATFNFPDGMTWVDDDERRIDIQMATT